MTVTDGRRQGFGGSWRRMGEREIDATAFGEWVRPYWQDMFWLATRLCGPVDGDDVLQDALLTAWRKRHRFDATRGTPRVWLLAVVADHARKAQRRMGRRPIAASRDSPVPGPHSEVDLDIASALKTLSPRQRTAVALRYYIGLSTHEIAQVMTCSDGTVKSTLSDARGRLRKILGEDYRHGDS